MRKMTPREHKSNPHFVIWNCESCKACFYWKDDNFRKYYSDPESSLQWHTVQMCREEYKMEIPFRHVLAEPDNGDGEHTVIDPDTGRLTYPVAPNSAPITDLSKVVVEGIDRMATESLDKWDEQEKCQFDRAWRKCSKKFL